MSTAPRIMNPFPGLRPFTQEEDYLFFGREEQTIELLQRLGNNRFVAVVGSSGSGKSSLVRCGLLSELQGGRMLDAGAAWEIAVAHPGGNPLALLAEALLESGLYDREVENARENLLATLSRSHFGLVEAIKQADLGDGTNFLLVVDQFEEIFRFHEAGLTQQETANEFVSLLLEAASQKEVPIYVVLTMRSDFIGECAQFEGLAERVNQGEFLIPRLTREQYKRVIEGPIKVAGGQIAPRLLQRLLNDLGQQADQLPCLQHALMRTWNIWAATGDAEALDLDNYQRVGKMSQALSLHADEIYESLADDRQRELCQGIFQALTFEESNSRGIRRPQQLGRLCQILQVSADEVRPIIDAYRQSGVTFLMPSPEIELVEQTIIDISHESLMRVWTRLRLWVEEETQAAGIYHRLSESAELHKRGKAGLYRDPELGIAMAWRDVKRPNAAWAERYRPGFAAAMNFLDTSQQASFTEERVREAARQFELEQARQLAEEQRLRLEQQLRSARKMRKMMAGVALVAVIAGIACVAALVARNEAATLAQIAAKEADKARENEDQAKRNEKLAEHSQQETVKALAVVESQKAEVETSLSKAQTAEETARAAEEQGRQLQYTTDMQLAPFVWGDGRATALKLRNLLAKHNPDYGTTTKNEASPADEKPDLRGFEWHYYQHLLVSVAAVFSGHDSAVVAATIIANRKLLTLDQNGQLRCWDLNSQSEDEGSRRDFRQGHSSSIRLLSPDGRLAAMEENNKISIVELSAGKELVQIDFAMESGRRLIFTPDSERLVIVDNKIRWCEATSGREIASLDQKFNRSSSLAVSADGLTLAVVGHGDLGNQFSIFRLDTTAKSVTTQVADAGNTGTFSAATLSPDGRLLAVGYKLSGSVVIFDTATGDLTAEEISAHASGVSSILFSRDGLRLVTADVDGTIKIWEDPSKLTSKKLPLMTLKGHTAAVTHLRISSNGNQLISTSADKTARIWDFDRIGGATRILERAGDGTVMRFSPDGELIAAAGGRSGVRMWDASTGKLVRQLSAGHKGRVYSVAFSPTDRHLLAVGYGGQPELSFVTLWNIDTGTELARLPGATDLPNFNLHEYTSIVGALAFSPDGKYLVAGFGSPRILTTTNEPSPLKVWDVATRRLIRRLDGHRGYCVSLDFSKDGTRLASGSRDGTAIIWSTETWKATQTLETADVDSTGFGQAGKGIVEDVAFSPDSRTLAVSSHEGSILLWDVATGKLVESLKGHTNSVKAAAFSPDGRTLATGGRDQTIRLWNVATRRELMQLDSTTAALGDVESLAFSPDGKHLLAGGRTNSAIWSTAPIVWSDAERGAKSLEQLLHSNVDFRSRIRMLSENLRLHEALEKLDLNDTRVTAARAAAQANWHASRQAWPDAVAAFDRLVTADPVGPQDWLLTPGLLRVATALLNQDRPRDAAALLTGGAKRRAADSLSPAQDRVGVGLLFSSTGGQARVTHLLSGSPAARSRLRPNDIILKVNETEIAGDSLKKLVEMLAGDPGTQVRLTVRHSMSEQPEEIELTRERFVQDLATGELLNRMRAAINERLAKDLHNADLLALRADLAGQWSDMQAQVADYTEAIEALTRQTTEAAQIELGQLYGRRGNVHVSLRQWRKAVDDYARCVSDATTDETLLSNQALAVAHLAMIVTERQERFVQLGRQDESQGIKLVDYAVDGATEPADVEGQDCRLVQTSEPGHDGNGYAYFAIDPGFKLSRGLSVQVEIEYWASGSGNLRVQYDSQFWGAYAASLESVPLVKSAEWKTARFTLKDARFANSQNGSADFRFQVRTKSRFYMRRVSVKQLLPGEDIGDPWLQLAGVHRIRNESEALDKLIERHSRLSTPVGDLYAGDKEWSRAIEIYSNGITEQTTDVELLSKRARAYEAIKNWHAAAADWSRVATKNPDGAKLLTEFARRIAAGEMHSLANTQYEKAQVLYEQLLQAEPNNDLLATELAHVLLERQEYENSARWMVLKPAEVNSKAGTTMTMLEDSSILAGSENPNKDTYTFIAETNLKKIVTIRLDAMAHESLERGGPGVSAGNFALTELSLTAKPISDAAEAAIVNLIHPRADFEQERHPVSTLLDGNSRTSWSIDPQVGKNHAAMFDIESLQLFESEGGTKLTFTLDFQFGERLTLGRFRLSITDDPAAVDNEERRFAALKIADPWAKLAAAYQLHGNKQALHRLLADHPAAVSGLGELYAAAQDWERAVDDYSKAISPESKDAKPIAKRAEAYEKLKRWDLAVADWTRASLLEPDVAFDRFKSIGGASWRCDIQNGGACSVGNVDGAVVFTTTAATGIDWHIQAYQSPLQLENGAEYVIRFKMKSPDSCTVNLYAGIWEEDWHDIGLVKSFVPPSEFKDYEFTFVAHDVAPGNNRIGFYLGKDRGQVMVKEIVILKKRNGYSEAASRRGVPDASEPDWKRDIAELSQSITPETKDAKLLSKRAQAYEKLKRWDLAAADWQRASQQQSDVAFQRFKPIGAGAWRFDVHDGAACSMEDVDGTIVFTTTAVTGTDWHVQACYAPLQLENGAQYVIRFKMKSPDSCAVMLFAGIDQVDWHSIGLGESFVPPSEFKDYEFPFVAHDVVPGKNRIGFQLGTARGRVMVREIVILKKRDGATAEAVSLVVRRASAFVTQEKWDLALTEWRSVVAQDSNQNPTAFDQFLNARRWNEAVEFGLQLVKMDPSNSTNWLRVAPVLALTEDHASYSDFCHRMVKQFANSKSPVEVERLVKATLLRSGSIELANLPAETLAKLLEDGTVPDDFLPWGWATRALFAFRSGEAALAVKCVAKSEASKPPEFTHALNLSVLAISQYRLEHLDEAKRALEQASQFLKKLQAAEENHRHHDVLIAQILFHEAETLIKGATKP